MATHFFTQSWLLQAIGWGIINSFWQSAILWLMYKAITSKNIKCPALFKHHLSLLCLLGSLLWFVFTIATYYFSVKNNQSFSENFILISNNQIPIALNFLLPIFSTAYLGLLCFYTIQFCKQYFFLLPQRNKNLIKPPVDIRLFTRQAALHLGIKKNVIVWLTKNIDVPSVSGYFKPVILLPFTLLNQLSTVQVEAILLHELAHIKRDDYLINLLQLIAENLLFFNPFALLLSSTIKQEREKCCDDWVINYRYNQKEYAAALLLVEQHRCKQLTLALAATNGKKNLLKRVQRIFTTTPVTQFNFYQQIKLITAAVAVVAGVILLPPSFQKPSTNIFALSAKTKFNQPVFSKNLANSTEKESSKKSKNSKIFSRFVYKNKTKKINKNIEDATETYPIAFVNEALLQSNVELENTATNIVNNETLAAQSIIVKVEEENSGTRGKKLYYLQLNNDHGKTAIKPLAFINKQQPGKPTKMTGKKKISRKKVAA
jgi:beta-lactamase regulating signal transducer with metallopeptidase domain